jgi:hypothetical protein
MDVFDKIINQCAKSKFCMHKAYNTIFVTFDVSIPTVAGGRL